MNDLISREAIKDAIDRTTWYHQSNGVMVEGAHGVEDAWFKAEDVYKAIDNVPTEQPNIPTDTPTAQRTGRWELIDEQEPRRYGCSECRRLVWHIENYCPNCGSKMQEVEE